MESGTESGMEFGMELTVANAGAWLNRRGIPVTGAAITELGGGVSNRVILVAGPERRMVLKQSLGKLRVEKEWLSDRDRVFREAAAMRWLDGRVRGGRTPRVLFEDRNGFTIGMEGAPADVQMWKSRLFRGELDPAHARAAGTLLGSMIAASWANTDAERLFGDQKVFDQLRIDPYYRFTARQRPEAAEYIGRLVARSASRRISLVHGDWSPKNLLCGREGMWAIDWEVIHFGDPSYDVGFLLNHLRLKAFAMPERRAELAGLANEFLAAVQVQLPVDGQWVATSGFEHLPALMLARVDGKSPAEYLTEEMRAAARALALALMERPANTVEEVFGR